MNWLDGVLLASALFVVVLGWNLGFIRRLLSWVGLMAGVALAARFIPEPSVAGQPGSENRLLIVAGILLVAGFVGNTIGSLVGAQIRSKLGDAKAGYLDSAGGVVLGLGGLVAILWMIIPSVAEVPGWPARATRDSLIATEIHAALGDPPSVFSGLPEALGVDAVPQVFSRLDQSPEEVAPPPTDLPVSAAVLEQVESSSFRITSQVCSRVSSGSGFMVEGGLIVTNAHVVSGASSIEVEDPSGNRTDATLAAIDTDLDLALLRVNLDGVEPLGLAEAEVGDTGVVLGYPGGGDLVESAYVIDSEIRAVGRDLLDQRDVERDVLVLGSDMAPGDSGGALVNPDGDVVGVAFAIAPDRDSVAYAIDSSELAPLLDATTPESLADSGVCLR